MQSLSAMRVDFKSLKRWRLREIGSLIRFAWPDGLLTGC